mmetsp:Transcript_7554/g.10171  ORF Transcript_7554/g.10171 Transcript_7554/m.10171 type:complete len:261 (+) Transcript_7554:61-843(+)
MKIVDNRKKKHRKREFRILKKLCHPNIIRLESSFEYDNCPIGCLEFIDGFDLRVFMEKQRKPLSLEIIRRIIHQICSAVAYCHSKKVIHGDVKSENILIQPQKNHEIKLIDFGFSQKIKEKKTLIPSAASVLYAPPSDKFLTFAWDSWSVGVIFYLLAKRQLPFSLKELQSDQDFQPLFGKTDDTPPPCPGISSILQFLFQTNPSQRATIASILETSKWLNNSITEEDPSFFSSHPQSMELPAQPFPEIQPISVPQASPS